MELGRPVTYRVVGATGLATQLNKRKQLPRVSGPQGLISFVLNRWESIDPIVFVCVSTG